MARFEGNHAQCDYLVHSGLQPVIHKPFPPIRGAQEMIRAATKKAEPSSSSAWYKIFQHDYSVDFSSFLTSGVFSSVPGSVLVSAFLRALPLRVLLPVSLDSPFPFP
jgi:hypothetical protein